MTSYASLGPDSIVGSYRIVREIGRGGMGTVFEAVHTILPRRAAIKVMHPELLRQPGMATRMVQEAAILEDIKHPGLVRVFECNLLADHRPYIIMELVTGESLATHMQTVSTLSSLETAKILAEITSVLASVHARGIVHRDLKPDNILMTPTDGNCSLRVIDWGVARLGTLGRLTLDGMTPGTPLYMSPEQATGKNIGAPCDVYSLGVMAYEMLCGHPPFDGRTLAEVVAMHLTSEPAPLHERTCAPSELCDLVHRMLDKEPQFRPTALQVRTAARMIATSLDHSMDYAEITITPSSTPVVSERDMRVVQMRALAQQPVEDVVIVDPESLEHGQTEMLPVARRTRWTPEISKVVPHAAALPRKQAITPRAARDHVAGEIVLLEKRRA